MIVRDPVARVRASLVRTLRELRKYLRLPHVSRPTLEALLADAPAMNALEAMAAQAGLPGVARALAALAMGLGGGSVHLETAPARGARLLRPDG